MMDTSGIDLWIRGVTPAVGLGALISGVLTYKRNSKTKTAEFLLDLHKTFFVQHDYDEMKKNLDCDGADGEANLQAVVNEQSEDFTNFLNFFELVAYMESIDTLSRADTEALLGYYLDRLRSKEPVWIYIRKPRNGFEHLRHLLAERETQ
jgi:hypothetical protein